MKVVECASTASTTQLALIVSGVLKATIVPMELPRNHLIAAPLADVIPSTLTAVKKVQDAATANQISVEKTATNVQKDTLVSLSVSELLYIDQPKTLLQNI